MPVVAKPVSERRIAMARMAIIVTVAAWVAYFITWLLTDYLNPLQSSTTDRLESVIYLLVVTVLTASALAYLMSRLGFCYRTRSHHRTSRAVLESFLDVARPTLTTIVPSFQEEEHVITNTLLSAALQEYPQSRIVLLIDDPPVPRSRRARDQLVSARALPATIQTLLAEPAARFTSAWRNFETWHQGRGTPGLGVMSDLAEQYESAASWLVWLAERRPSADHTDAFFGSDVALRLAHELRTVAAAIREAANEGAVLDTAHIGRLYRRLAWTFTAELTSFERKRYVSLSHEPNKAMNLNSYLGLMGGSYREVRTPNGLALVPADPDDCTLTVPDSDYVLTLDADSILLPEYCLRLVHLLEQTEHRDTAIAQTPYSAFPGSATRLERIAGATTDLQHIVHQGLTYYDATFWVGANAVIRKRALDDIVDRSYLGDWEIRRYIRDRTVIEDTESTIDMGIHGWTLYNYPERLSYSATPPDFGALCIQRRRWANGGLLILPKLHRQSKARKTRGARTRFSELFLRWNYMASICWASISLPVLLAFPFNDTLISPLLGLIALPYFASMASDLRYCGYKRLDIIRIYGFNLILLPVNLAGTAASLVQGITASKAAFARTPKVRNRTVVPPTFVIAPYVLIGLAGFTFYTAYEHSYTENMAYAALNIFLAGYAVVAFIGIRNSIVDAWIHFTSLLYKPVRPHRRRRLWFRAGPQVPPPAVDWRSVLQVGYGAEPTERRAAPSASGRWAAPSAGDTLPLPAVPFAPSAALMPTGNPRLAGRPTRAPAAGARPSWQVADPLQRYSPSGRAASEEYLYRRLDGDGRRR
jgi:cellulose synthase/poly-beta-1,6-N-acetylglucosamine synthase-like glycosyltransferase